MNNWPHSPPHFIFSPGIYMVTAGTHLKTHFFQSDENLQFLNNTLLSYCYQFGWELHAWAVFSNHYHFIAKSPSDPTTLSTMIGKLHRDTALELNKKANASNRKIWFQYWDSKIIIHISYLARLNYVHQNPVKHGLVTIAANYPWCPASYFEAHANRSFIKSVYSFDSKKVKVFDEF